MSKVWLALALVLTTVGCQHRQETNTSRRFRVEPDRAHGWYCEGTLWYYPDTKVLHCDGSMHATVDSYDVKK